jgi:uncharacterized membrane protein (UPF0127 family)
LLPVLAALWLVLAAVTSDAAAADKLTIETADGPRSFQVEVADTPDERAQGLMHRESLPSGVGMLFLLDAPGPINMWMKNTLIPLDMLFIGADGRVSRIAERTEPGSLELIPSGGDVVAVLEINGGLAATLGIAVGDRVRHAALP